MINWNRSPVIICLWMILWGTEEQRLCKAVLSWHVSSDWNIDRMLSTFNHVLWSTHWHPLCNALWIMTEKKKKTTQRHVIRGPSKHLLWKFTLTSVGLFVFLPYSDLKADSITPDLSSTSDKYSSSCGITASALHAIPMQEGITTPYR